MRQNADSIRRPVVMFAVIIALCCLTGCEAIHELENLDNVDDNPMPQHRDDDKNTLDASQDLSVSGVLSKPACRTALLDEHAHNLLSPACCWHV
jgi:hypothetical protein